MTERVKIIEGVGREVKIVPHSEEDMEPVPGSHRFLEGVADFVVGTGNRIIHPVRTAKEIWHNVLMAGDTLRDWGNRPELNLISDFNGAEEASNIRRQN